jgi:glycosyltransferase involved in cell wall biosynthesis
MPEFYRAARFLVLPSVCLEMCPLSVLEAMALGIPVIGADIGGIPELVKDGVTGFLFPPGDAEQLADRMRRLWDDPGLCRSMGAAARAKALRDHGTETFGDRLLAVYNKVVGLVNTGERKGRLSG